MLRRAGFLSGVLTGFLPENKKAKTANAHATAFVLWPDEKGNNKIFSVDGTPPGIPGISGLSLSEKEQQADKEIQQMKQEAEEELDKIMQTVASQDTEEIKKLINGKLEQVVNTILRYEVKMSDLLLLRRVLEAYWYTPAKDMDLSQVKEFLSEEYKSEKEWLKYKPAEYINQPAGKYLFETVQAFIERFIRRKHVENITESFDLVEDIFNAVKSELSPTEQRVITAIVTYLRAKEMSKG